MAVVFKVIGVEITEAFYVKMTKEYIFYKFGFQ